MILRDQKEQDKNWWSFVPASYAMGKWFSEHDMKSFNIFPIFKPGSKHVRYSGRVLEELLRWPLKMVKSGTKMSDFIASTSLFWWQYFDLEHFRYGNLNEETLKIEPHYGKTSFAMSFSTNDVDCLVMLNKFGTKSNESGSPKHNMKSTKQTCTTDESEYSKFVGEDPGIVNFVGLCVVDRRAIDKLASNIVCTNNEKKTAAFFDDPSVSKTKSASENKIPACSELLAAFKQNKICKVFETDEYLTTRSCFVCFGKIHLPPKHKRSENPEKRRSPSGALNVLIFPWPNLACDKDCVQLAGNLRASPEITSLCRLSETRKLHFIAASKWIVTCSERMMRMEYCTHYGNIKTSGNIEEEGGTRRGGRWGVKDARRKWSRALAPDMGFYVGSSFRNVVSLLVAISWTTCRPECDFPGDISRSFVTLLTGRDAFHCKKCAATNRRGHNQKEKGHNQKEKGTQSERGGDIIRKRRGHNHKEMGPLSERGGTIIRKRRDQYQKEEGPISERGGTTIRKRRDHYQKGKEPLSDMEGAIIRKGRSHYQREMRHYKKEKEQWLVLHTYLPAKRHHRYMKATAHLPCLVEQDRVLEQTAATCQLPHVMDLGGGWGCRDSTNTKRGSLCEEHAASLHARERANMTRAGAPASRPCPTIEYSRVAGGDGQHLQELLRGPSWPGTSPAGEEGRRGEGCSANPALRVCTSSLRESAIICMHPRAGKDVLPRQTSLQRDTNTSLRPGVTIEVHCDLTGRQSWRLTLGPEADPVLPGTECVARVHDGGEIEDLMKCVSRAKQMSARLKYVKHIGAAFGASVRVWEGESVVMSPSTPSSAFILLDPPLFVVDFSGTDRGAFPLSSAIHSVHYRDRWVSIIKMSDSCVRFPASRIFTTSWKRKLRQNAYRPFTINRSFGNENPSLVGDQSHSDWQNLSKILSCHGRCPTRVKNLQPWCELSLHLNMNKTIDEETLKQSIVIIPEMLTLMLYNFLAPKD
ncbi:hypothetical protein PR048_029082 [Dryococelus australis]|uniref:Uncharacterized protein n=1 Tax=Dryococelus australis TaxID=614101 RepID=A0ABQ9GEX8_9NEOP|nr:hypothetical protein PR048_029082 [Dryococelus australis]